MQLIDFCYNTKNTNFIKNTKYSCIDCGCPKWLLLFSQYIIFHVLQFLFLQLVSSKQLLFNFVSKCITTKCNFIASIAFSIVFVLVCVSLGREELELLFMSHGESSDGKLPVFSRPFHDCNCRLREFKVYLLQLHIDVSQCKMDWGDISRIAGKGVIYKMHMTCILIFFSVSATSMSTSIYIKASSLPPPFPYSFMVNAEFSLYITILGLGDVKFILYVLTQR